MTSLFCDLVGFTASSEAADPEDVDRMLAAYFGVVRAQIEAHGGVVEKFIGDAVVGVFGVPAAHEDDPERAVRAGLRIVEEAERLMGVGGLRCGCGSGSTPGRRSSGWASPRPRARGSWPGMRSTRPRGSSRSRRRWVSRSAMRPMRRPGSCSTTRSWSPRRLKGKAEPVRVFHAKAPRARFGTDLTRTHDSPFVGREIDLAILKGVFDKTVAASSVQLVTVIGEPGLGKSRIVAELGDYVDARPDLVTWRQGRCLPYGEGITFWALGEILKAHTGILESDPPDVARAKLDRVLAGRVGARVVPPAPVAVARDRGDIVGRTRGAVHGLAQVPRTDRRRAPDGAGVRGPALGGRGDARLPRAPRRPRRRRAAAPGRHRPARAVRAPSRLRHEAPERDTDQPGAVVAGGDRPARLGPAGRDRASGRGAAADPRPRRTATRSTPRSSCGC